MAGDEKKRKKNSICQLFNCNISGKVEGIHLQDGEFDPGGPLFRRKNKKSQKGVPWKRVAPHTFCWNNSILEKKSFQKE